MGKFKTGICLLTICLTVAGCGTKSNSAKANKSSALQTEKKVSATDGSQTDANCQNRIFFLPQTHANVLEGGLQVAPENFDKTARSQFAIAKYLENHPGLPVFSEQVSSDQKIETVSEEFRKSAAQIKTMFPQGLPANFEDLSEQQADIIARAGGDAISFILRHAEKLHRVVENDQVQDDLIDQISSWSQKNPNAITAPPEILNLVFKVRETMALEQINNYIKSNPAQRDLILIYGSAHTLTFKTHPELFPAECIIVPEEFKARGILK